MHNQEQDEPTATESGASSGMKHEGEASGEPIIGEQTIWWTLAGLLIGGALGWMLGLAFGYGKLNISGLAPLVAGGAGVSGFIFASFFGSLFGLTGALLATYRETHVANERKQNAGQKKTGPAEMSHDKHGGSKSAAEGKSHHKSGHPSQHGKPSFVQRLPIYGSIVLALFMAYTLFAIASRALGSGTPSDQSNRVTWNQKNAARVGGASDAETGSYVLQTAYPATHAENSPQMIVTVAADWHAALAATVLIARPTNAALIINETSETDSSAAREIERLRAATGSALVQTEPSLQGSPATFPTPLPSPNASPSPASSPSPTATPQAPRMLSIGTTMIAGGEMISGGDPAPIAAAIDERRAGAMGQLSANVIVVAADADYRWAVPAGAYAARTGTPILFVTRDGVPQATAAALNRRNKQAHLFVLGPESAVSANIVDALKQFGTVTRIEGGDYFENAVRFAEFRDSRWDPLESTCRHASLSIL